MKGLQDPNPCSAVSSHRPRLLSLVVVCVLIMFVFVLSGCSGNLVPSAYAASIASASWKVVPTPNPSTSSSALRGVSAVSSNNAWAAGYTYDSSSSSYKTLIEQWNGTQWHVVPSPNPSTTNNNFNAVVAISANNAWAVGYYNSATGGQTLIEHWNGTKWSVVASPNLSTSSNSLMAIAALSDKDVWAVGTYANSAGSFQTLTEHWNGTTWSVVPSPSPGALNNGLSGVTVVSATDAWAVGSYFINPDPDTLHTKTLIEHWNGTKWSVVASPNPTLRTNVLHAVGAVSANDVWAVGNTSRTSNPNSVRTMVQHWNGTKWSVVPSPNHSTGNNALLSVTVIAANNIWAVGNYGTAKPPLQTLTERWDGTSWKVVASPNVGTDLNSLESASHVPGTQNVWAVGEYFDTTINAWRTLAEYYS
jgi:hypothetical protein